MIKLLYAIPTHHCNLSCPHCEISKQPEHWDHDKFLEVLNSVVAGSIDLFGGEPTFYRDRFLDIYRENKLHGKTKINGVSTNLTILDDDIIQVYQDIGHIATSWNPHRFGSIEMFRTWLDNCKVISKEGIGYTLLITLTMDLFTEYPPETFPEFLKSIIAPGLKEIKFEQYVGESADKFYLATADHWLATVIRNWNLPAGIKIANVNRVKRWWNDCRHVYTLFPNGEIQNTCPHGDMSAKIALCEDCLDCQYAATCIPCKLQSHCSYMYETRDAVLEKWRKDRDEN